MFNGTEPPVIGFVGPSGAGKTTLLERLLARWARSGWRVGVIKHAHHALRPDDPNTDTARLARAGAAAVRAAPWEEPWHAAVRRLVEQDARLDWIVTEGYHAAPVVQILVVRDARDASAERERARGWVVGVVAGGRGSPAGGVRAWTPADVAELAAFVACAARPRPPAAGAAGTTGERPGPAGARLCGLVLAGGRSRRMGRDKAGLEWQGRTWLDRVSAAVAEATAAPPLVVGRRGPAGSSVPDLLPGSGPLAGVVSGAYRTRALWMLVVACDMPFLTSEALQPLLERLPAVGRDVDAVVPVVDGRHQLTCALYARRRLHAAVARLAEGRRGLHAWLDGLRVVEVGEDAWTRRGLDPRIALADVDDPDTWERVAGVAAPSADA